MNNKQTILKILDKHRDMSLTMGCEVEVNGYTKVYKLVSDQKGILELIDEWEEQRQHVNDYDCTVLGHPATPLTLLKALDSRKTRVLGTGETYGVDEIVPANTLLLWHETGEAVLVPLTTTLTEIPHTHQLWTDLLPILS